MKTLLVDIVVLLFILLGVVCMLLFGNAFQLSFFLAGFALDQRRIEARRDGMCCWR